jgi:succinyl-CoA synthetase beta subunit
VGTGVSLTAMDELVRQGFFPANFCDTSGNPPASKLYRATRIILGQPDLGGYFFISCISSQQLDNTARGIIKGFKERYPKTGGVPDMPSLLVFRGAWEEEAIDLFRQHGIAGPSVRILGRESSERDAVRIFGELYERFR